MQVFRIWIVVCFVLQLIVAPVAAEQHTDPSIFKQYGTCSEYHRFLSGQSDHLSTACHALPDFLMAHADLSHQDFIVEAARNHREESGLAMMLSTLYSLQEQDEAATFYWADQADRTLFAQMRVSQDYSRANLYSWLLSGIKYKVLDAVCEPSGCKLGEIEFSATDELGEDYSIIDQADFDVVLMCLVRADGFVTPVSKVVSSQRFQACMFPS